METGARGSECLTEGEPRDWARAKGGIQGRCQSDRADRGEREHVPGREWITEEDPEVGNSLVCLEPARDTPGHWPLWAAFGGRSKGAAKSLPSLRVGPVPISNLQTRHRGPAESQVLNPGQGSKAPGVRVLVAARGPSDMPVGRPTPLPSPPRTRWDLQQPQLARLTPVPLPPPFLLYHRARAFSSFHTSRARGWAD